MCCTKLCPHTVLGEGKNTHKHSHNSTTCCNLKSLKCLLSSNSINESEKRTYVVIEAYYLWHLPTWFRSFVRNIVANDQNNTNWHTLHTLFIHILWLSTTTHTNNSAVVFDPKKCKKLHTRPAHANKIQEYFAFGCNRRCWITLFRFMAIEWYYNQRKWFIFVVVALYTDCKIGQFIFVVSVNGVSDRLGCESSTLVISFADSMSQSVLTFPNVDYPPQIIHRKFDYGICLQTVTMKRKNFSRIAHEV